MKNFACLFVNISLYLLPFIVHAGKITGRVTDESGAVLPFASILIKNSTQGTTANNEGKYFLQLSAGTYTIVCQYVGYERSEKKIVISNEDIVLDFQLSRQQLLLDEVVIKQGGEDPAYEIIRNAIKKRPFYLKQLDTFQCEVYQKGQMRLRNYPKKFMGEKVDFEDGDTSKRKIIYLSESVMKYSSQNDKSKTEVISTKVSGQKNGFGFGLPDFISFYQNNIRLGQGLNPRGFISPIADNALNFYKYKYEGSFFEDGKEINHIKIIPKRKYEPLFSGYINITEGDWRIHSIDVQLTKEAQIQMIDTLRINQLYVPYNENLWVIKTQVAYPAIKIFGFDAFGNIISIYSKFDAHPVFEKNFFDKTILKFNEGSNKKSSEYWDDIRPVPLQTEELKDYKKKDSLEQVRQSPHYKDSVDRVRNKLKISKILLAGQTFSKEKKRSYLTINSLMGLVNFNTVQGWSATAKVNYTKQLDSTGYNRQLTISPSAGYGFSNKHLNAYLDMSYSNGKRYRSNIAIGGGKDIFQFNNANPIGPVYNAYASLIWKHNYMKIYEAWVAKIDYAKGIADGVTAKVSFQYQDRMPLENTTDWSWKKWENRTYTPNYATELMPQNFQRHQASVLSLGINWRPGCKFIDYPDRLYEIRSKYPTFTADVAMGLKNIFGSDVDYGKWHLSVNDNINLKLAGSFEYNISVGGFYRVNQIQVQDYNHFNGNQITVVNNYFNNFLLLPYYKFSNTANFYSEAHATHHFNGLLTNKIPLFKRFNWHLVGSANAFYSNKQKNYIEASVGLENIIKIIRADFVWGFEYGQAPYTGFRLGIKGIFSSK